MDPLSPQARAVRFRCNLAARLRLGEAEALAARVLDLSATGAFVQTDVDLRVGERVAISIAAPRGATFEVGAVVTRLGKSQLEIAHHAAEHLTVLKLGAGLCFDVLPAPAASTLRAMLQELEPT